MTILFKKDRPSYRHEGVPREIDAVICMVVDESPCYDADKMQRLSAQIGTLTNIIGQMALLMSDEDQRKLVANVAYSFSEVTNG